MRFRTRRDFYATCSPRDMVDSTNVCTLLGSSDHTRTQSATAPDGKHNDRWTHNDLYEFLNACLASTCMS
ncbi:MAG: hypothetical protein KatS3mg113_0738 [Planctomycetaceae bacterium]|nr:MAG: hypothetical protein KatS3mg113_0738 [Planctomycetaceae bacterium]